MHIEPFYHQPTGTFTYVLTDASTKLCAIIDPVLDFDAAAGRVSTDHADQIIAHIKAHQLKTQWLLETHIHADHLTASHYLQQQLGGHTGISSKFTDILPHWIPLFDTGDDTPMDGSQFDYLWSDQATFQLGELTIKVLHTPGHTPACASFCVGDAVFVGDTLFHPELGTARVDFPGGDANILFSSIQRLYALPDHTQVYLCHDYPENRPPVSCVPLADQKTNNVMLNQHTSRQEFIDKRTARDQQLAVPELILPSIQCNMRLGALAQAHENGIQYIRIPINQL